MTHRIHCDRGYTIGGRRPARFSFSARRPLFDTETFYLCGRFEAAARLWAEGPGGGAAMTGETVFASDPDIPDGRTT